MPKAALSSLTAKLNVIGGGVFSFIILKTARFGIAVRFKAIGFGLANPMMLSLA